MLTKVDRATVVEGRAIDPNKTDEVEMTARRPRSSASNWVVSCRSASSPGRS
jgi:hypothetical protein